MNNWPYLENGVRYGQGTVLLITNMKCHTPCHTRWKSLTLYDVEVRYALLWLNGARYGLDCYLLFITNRKRHIGFQITWKSSTLDYL